MRLIKPTPVTSAMLVSTDVTETVAAYNGATTYAAAALARDTVNHRIMKSVAAGNTGHALTDPAWWLDTGPDNTFAVFDEGVGTLTTRIGSMEYVLTLGSITALAVLDSNAETATLEMKRLGVTIYNQTRSFNRGGQAINSWYRWLTEPIGIRTQVDFDKLPDYSDCEVTLTLTGRDSGAAVTAGTVIPGRSRSLGTTEKGAKSDIISFSVKEQDQFGVWRVAKRGFSKRMTLRTQFPTAEADIIYQLLTELRDTAVLWFGEDGYDQLAVYGFVTDFSIELTEGLGSVSYLNITIEGLSSST